MLSDNPSNISWAHPIVREWFLRKFGSPTEPQLYGWPAILSGKATLISAPTGSGKTLAAFLVCIDTLVRKALEGNLNNKTEVIYVSPLKALSNDIQKNLAAPLSEIRALAEERGLCMDEIRVLVRTGDTLAKERQSMLKKPPHILVTTPESLYILLTAQKSRVILADVRTIIVDEIHALLDDKRGSHLALSLERLEALTHVVPVRIGLSATQKPIETVGDFLVGNGRPRPTIVNVGHLRCLDLAIEVPSTPLSAVASNAMWDEVYGRIAELAGQNRSTLVFVNTRRLAERVAHHLAERLEADQVAAHHGSLSRKIRLDAEEKLKNGALKILVATASLELGIDIGSIDLVCQISSPRAIAVGLQRVGRAGHWRGAIPKGRFFPTTREDLLECAALIYAIRKGDLDRLIIPEQPLDILSQQIIAACSAEEWQEDDLFALVKRAYPYRNLSQETFNSIIEMLSEGIAGTRGRYSAYLFRDQVNGIIRARRGARLIAITSGGAIPDNGLYTVISQTDEVMVGTLDEDFAIESNRGDIILLGSASWRVKRVDSIGGKVFVEDAHGAPPNVPFWRGEAPARTYELSMYVSKLREKINHLTLAIDPIVQEQEVLDLALLKQNSTLIKAINWLEQECGVDAINAFQLVNYIMQGRALLTAVPSQNTVIAERFFDEGGGMQLVIHAPFGARINKAWGLALRKRFCRSFNFELQAAATDNGINIALTEQHSFPLQDVFHFLHPHSVKEVVTQAVLQSPLFPTRWRWDASRSLALVRFRNGKKVPPHILRMLSDDLLAAVFPDAAACQDNLAGRDIELPEHPLIQETIKDVLTEALDIEGFIDVLHKILNGEIKTIAVDTPLPSVFAHEILNANPYAFLDDAPLEERRARAVEMRRILPESLVKSAGSLDPAAIKNVQQQAWPDVRNEDELHDCLQTFIAFPQDFLHEHTAVWQSFSKNLLAANRIAIAEINNKTFWVAAEKSQTFLAIYPDAVWLTELVSIAQKNPEIEEALALMLRGWLQHLAPVTVLELSEILALPLAILEQTCLKLESTGLILRGHFRNTSAGSLEWCERRLLARIHRETLGRLRKEIEPVSATLFLGWLLNWQHITPDTQLRGEEGVLQVIKQLQGFEIPAKAWEKQILSKRISDYHAGMLDRLCLNGLIGWGRLSTHPAFQAGNDNARRITPSSVAPITFFLREECNWIDNSSLFNEGQNEEKLSAQARVIFQYLKNRGASFFTDIVRNNAQLKSDVENGLWELVAAGFVTADAFDNLRALIDPHRRGGKSGYRQKPRYSGGRWTLFNQEPCVDPQQKLEASCWMLLHRYGVVFREILTRETMLPRWRELLNAFRRLEERGEIRGGRFVSGFIGEQFALPYAVESLRTSKKTFEKIPNITVSAVDPLNLLGIILPGERIAAISGKTALLESNLIYTDK